MKQLDIALILIVAYGGSVAAVRDFPDWINHAAHILLFIFIVITSERYSAAWWIELTNRSQRTEYITSDMVIASARSRTSLLAFIVPIESRVGAIKSGVTDEVREYVNKSTSAIVLGLLLLFTSMLILLWSGFDDDPRGGLFGRILETQLGKIGVYAVSTFLCCWSLSFYMFSKSFFIRRNS